MRKVSSQIQFYYQRRGDHKTPVILFLHGFMGSGNDWDEVVHHLSPYYGCLTVDLPGHGKTKLDGEILFEKTARALIEFLKLQQIKKCFVVGYSMGGRIALFLALRYPQYFEKVILESATPGLRTKRERDERIKHDDKIALELEEGDYFSFLKKWYHQPIFKGITAHKNYNQLLRVKRNQNTQMFASALRILGSGKQPSLWGELSRNKVPILLLIGENDVKFKSIAKQMSELNIFIQVITVEKCSHNIHFQQPEQFADYLHRFFQSTNKFSFCKNE